MRDPAPEELEQVMSAKKILLLAAVALIVFYVLAQPTQAANAAHTVLGWLGDGADAIIKFVRELFT